MRWPWSTKRTARRALGDKGESMACRYLKKHCRMKILCRNVNYIDGELDIVALDGNDLVFVEVRSRTDESYMTAEHSVTMVKRQRVIAAARRFVRTRRLQLFRPRFDVVAIAYDTVGKPDIRYHRAAFDIGGRPGASGNLP